MKIPERPPVLDFRAKFEQASRSLIENDKFLQFQQYNETRYYYWDKWKFIAKDWKLDPSHLWSAVKVSRLLNYVVIPKSVVGKDFRAANHSIIQRHLHEFDLHLGGSIRTGAVIPSADREQFLQSSLMEESIASSQLEGAATSRKIAREMLESNRKPVNAAEQMILNNYEAMKWVVANQEKSFTTANILKLQGILTRNTLVDQDVGRFRRDDEVKVVDNQTGAVLHTPPPFENLEQLMKAFCDFANAKNNGDVFVHPMIKGIALHFLIGYIHPFADGNGRTARTIFYWYLLKHKYWLIEFMSVSRIILDSKTQYAKAYLHTEFDDNDLTYFILYNLKAISGAHDELKNYISRQTAEKQNLLSLLRNSAFNERQISVIREIMHDATKSYSVKQIETIYQVSNQTARNDLTGLVAAGILTDRKLGKQVQFFPAKGYLKKITGK